MAETFRQSCDSLSAFEKASEVHSTIGGLRSAEQELTVRIAQQEFEIKRMQDMLDSVESIRSEVDHLRADEPRILPFPSASSESPAPSSTQNPAQPSMRKTLQLTAQIVEPASGEDAGLWARFMQSADQSSDDQSESGSPNAQLDNQMSALEKELAAGESELQMAQQALKTLLRSQGERDRKIEREHAESVNEDIDELQGAKKELQAKLRTASNEADQLRDRIASLENAQAEHSDIDEQLNQLRERQEDQQASFASEIENLHGHIEESSKIETSLRADLANAIDLLKQYKQTAEATQASGRATSEELLQSVHRAESYKRRLESSARTAAEQREKLASQLGELTEQNKTLQADLDATVEELEGRREHEAQLEKSLETERETSSATNSELEELRQSYSSAQAEMQLLRAAIDELASHKKQREDELQQSLATQCDSTAEIQSELTSLQQTYSSTQAEMQLLCEAIDELNTQKSEREAKLNGAHKKLGLFKQSDLSIKAALKQEREAASVIRSELDQLCETHKCLQDECAEQVSQIELLIAEKESLTDESDVKGKSLNAQTSELLKLRAIHESLSAESQKQSAELATLIAQRDQYIKENEAKDSLLKQRHDEVEQLHSDRKKLSQELAEQTDQVKSLAAENKYLVAEDKRKEETLAERKKELAKLCDKHDKLNTESKKGVECIETLIAENETLTARNRFNETSLETRRNELAELWLAHETLQGQAKTQIIRIEQLMREKEELRNVEQKKTRLVQEHQNELATLREMHGQLQSKSDDQAAEIATMITVQESMAAERLSQATALAARQAELDELHAAHEKLKSVSEQQALRVEQLIAEKELACTERDEAEKLSYMNLQAAAADFENLQVEKLTLESQFEELSATAEDVEMMSRRTKQAPKKNSRKKAAKPADDLTIIEGIGPKISQLLGDKRITTFRKLSSTPIQRLNNILEQAGGNFRTHDPTTWPEQAKLAASDEWEKLGQLQDELMGGRRV